MPAEFCSESLQADVSTDLLLKDRDRGARPLALDVLEELEKSN